MAVRPNVQTTICGVPGSENRGDVTSIHPTPHPEYYFEDGSLVILVENILFRVFRSTFIRHSAVFCDLFSLPTPSGRPTEGANNTTPLQLPDVTARDFERLLWVLYPSDYAAPRARTADDWTAVLSLATRWDFPSVRALAIVHLQADATLGPVERILLARAYDIPDAPRGSRGSSGGGEWLLAAYTELCTRPEPLSVDEAVQLGAEDAARVAALRERLRGRNPAARFGGYCAPTRSSVAREAAVMAARAERQSLGVGAAGGRAQQPPRGTAAAKGKPQPAARRDATAIPGPARLIAETFGIATRY